MLYGARWLLAGIVVLCSFGCKKEEDPAAAAKAERLPLISSVTFDRYEDGNYAIVSIGRGEKVAAIIVRRQDDLEKSEQTALHVGSSELDGVISVRINHLPPIRLMPGKAGVYHVKGTTVYYYAVKPDRRFWLDNKEATKPGRHDKKFDIAEFCARFYIDAEPVVHQQFE